KPRKTLKKACKPTGNSQKPDFKSAWKPPGNRLEEEIHRELEPAIHGLHAVAQRLPHALPGGAGADRRGDSAEHDRLEVLALLHHGAERRAGQAVGDVVGVALGVVGTDRDPTFRWKVVLQA